MKYFLRIGNPLVLVVLLLSSCGSYKQNIMFKVADPEQASQLSQEAERNYVIQKNDFLKLRVYTSNGELIIDPDLKLLKEIPPQVANTRPDPDYLVDINGVAKLPMVGELKLEGLTIRQAEAILQKEYAKYYTNPFVILQYANKRVIVLGATGGQVIPLLNENTPLVEVLALATGLNNDSKAHNIRVIRGDQVILADLSTFEGYKKSNMIMQPGDIVYVEPIRRPASEALRDYGPLVSIITSLTTLVVVLTNR
ncbi:MAG: polysaccharide biosynthesis/export family protein [Cyclobacteriaceae bacterium]|nr:MAG: polysaccharide biosynthesis/export family protein [Cyclobacteriaceae bacterium]